MFNAAYKIYSYDLWLTKYLTVIFFILLKCKKIASWQRAISQANHLARTEWRGEISCYGKLMKFFFGLWLNGKK